MEMYLYKCAVCGFAHQVPAYWVNYSPDLEMSFVHFRTDTKEQCESIILLLEKQE